MVWLICPWIEFTSILLNPSFGTPMHMPTYMQGTGASWLPLKAWLACQVYACTSPIFPVRDWYFWWWIPHVTHHSLLCLFKIIVTVTHLDCITYSWDLLWPFVVLHYHKWTLLFEYLSIYTFLSCLFLTSSFLSLDHIPHVWYFDYPYYHCYYYFFFSAAQFSLFWLFHFYTAVLAALYYSDSAVYLVS